MNKPVSGKQLISMLDSKYHSIIIENPSDSVESFINAKLYEFANRLNSDSINESLTRKKLDSIMSMTNNERLALAVIDMQKRNVDIPAKYRHLKLQNENDNKRDLILNASEIKKYIIKSALIAGCLGFAAGACLVYLLSN